MSVFSTPDDPELRARMRAAHTHAGVLLGVTAKGDTPERQEAWGHGGRTFGAAVYAGADGDAASERLAGKRPAWLRVAAAPEGQHGGKLWEGTAFADEVLPVAVPRPALLAVKDFADATHVYRAELTTLVTATVCSTSPDLTRPLHAAESWWRDLRRALDMVAATPVPDGREPVISQAYITRSIPRFLGSAGLDTIGVDTKVATWTLAHGDLHFANLTAPELSILDWEGIGPAPAGFDAANLHAYALADPPTAARIRTVFADVLDCPAGRLAELTVAAMILQAADRDPYHARLAAPVRNHASHLLDRTVPRGQAPVQ